MIKKKPIARKPVPGARKGGAPKPPPDDDSPQEDVGEAEGEGEGAVAAPQSGGADDELALQEAPEVKLSGEQFKRMRPRATPQARGASMDVEDTSKLLIAAWAVMGAVVIGSIFWLLSSSNKPPEATEAPVTPAVSPAAQAELEDQRYRANSANKAAFVAYINFGQWAYREAPDSSGETLTAKMKQDVQMGSVDDPDMKQIYTLQLENFKLSPTHPLRGYEAVIGAVGEVKGPESSPTQNSFQKNEGIIKGMTQKLRKRYDVKL